jgi:hypothetical protein
MFVYIYGWLPQMSLVEMRLHRGKAINENYARRGWRPADISRSPEHHIAELREI